MAFIGVLCAFFLKKIGNETKEKEEKIGLTKLPALVLRRITDELDFQSVKNIRATCKYLQEHAPNPYEKVTAIKIKMESACTSVTFFTAGKSYVMKVRQCQNTWESLLLFDWDLIFQQRKTPLKHFGIESNKYIHDSQFSLIYKFFRKILKSYPPLLVESLHLDVSDQDDVLSILVFCDPKHLKSINLDGDIGEIMDEDKAFPLDKLYNLDQWKNAEEFELWSVRDFAETDLNPDLTPFSHFSYLCIPWSEVQRHRGRRRGWKPVSGKIENIDKTVDLINRYPEAWVAH